MSEERQAILFSCPSPATDSAVIRLGHGSGGKMTSRLIETVFLPLIGNDILNQLDDAAFVTVPGTLAGTGLAITTDSYVVSPIFFPGGDIGSLAINGTINDLAMRGAKPLYLSASFIIEEGMSIDDLTKITASVRDACLSAQVKLVAADTKVVNRGAADKLFITTSGIGIIETSPVPAANRAEVGDCILVSGDVGRHGVAVMSCREGLDLETAILSDTFPLHNIVQTMLSDTSAIHCLRDITRGGLASVLNELASASQVGIQVKEEAIPIHPEVRGVCELLGLDPLYVACEGRLVAIVSAHAANEIMSNMRNQPGAEGTAVIGAVVADHRGRVVLRSRVGGSRILDKLSGEQLPRIC